MFKASLKEIKNKGLAMGKIFQARQHEKGLKQMGMRPGAGGSSL
jgi:hypothetical protein